jgi:transcription elongation factor GreA
VTQYVSQEGLEKLKKELEERKGSIRSEINRRLIAAKQLGDLSENAEFAEAKEAQLFNEGKIEELEEMLKEVSIIKPVQNHGSEVMIGSSIKLKSEKGERSYTIVGPSESNPAQGFISNESPLGKAVIGHKKGDEIEVRTPGGMVMYTIIEIM